MLVFYISSESSGVSQIEAIEAKLDEMQKSEDKLFTEGSSGGHKYQYVSKEKTYQYRRKYHDSKPYKRNNRTYVCRK